MPKPENSNSNDGPSFQAPRYRPNWLAALVCFVLGAYITVALVAYSPKQSKFITDPPTEKNPVGWIGAESVHGLLMGVGLSAWLMPVFLIWLLIVSIRSSRHLTGTRIIAMIVAIASFAGLATMFMDSKSMYFPSGAGGLIGEGIYTSLLKEALGPFGSGLLLGTIYCGAQLFIFTRDIGAEIEKMIHGVSTWWAERGKRKAALAEQLAKEREAQSKQKAAAAAVSASVTQPPVNVGPSGKKTFVPKSAEDPLAKPAAPRSGPTPGDEAAAKP
ncbi:MAG: DNA translocase FtsK 4TM domain-containing protein, partial [Verrucomicrobia bacterium]|nr:DNA translocase FtsK 4TM domain-containing protein [Verrucomicrobiota bacterium]